MADRSSSRLRVDAFHVGSGGAIRYPCLILIFIGCQLYMTSFLSVMTGDAAMWRTTNMCEPVETAAAQAPLKTKEESSQQLFVPPLNLDDQSNATCDDILQHWFLRNAQYQANDPKTLAPLYHYGFYAGQGFGRVLEHSTLTCMLGLFLDRPCVVDVSDRDEFYTWRSFLHTGTYDWEIRGRVHQYQAAVKGLIQLLPGGIGDGEWAPNQWPNLPHQESIYALQTPSSWPNESKPEFWQGIQVWKDPSLNQKLLLSPNWGTSWFTKIKFPTQLGSCSQEELMTKMMNQMYQPTAMAHHLHKERLQRLFNTSTAVTYGSIHIRTVILELIGQNQDTLKPAALAKTLQECTQQYNLTRWWILSDKPELARNLSALVPNYHQAYDEEFAFVHSNSESAKELYGHGAMAPSIMDWMALFQSQVALITSGAYGATGARGNGKVRSDRKCSFLQIFE